MENRYNLIDEPWIKVSEVGLVSLRDLFGPNHYCSLAGSPIQKVSVTKLLLAIAQSACTPEDDEAWAHLGPEGLAQRCLSYLDQCHDRFYLYGARPFLQMPEVKSAAVKSYGTVLPEISTGNTTVLTQSQVEKPLTDADKAMLIVVTTGYALGGKKVSQMVLTPEYKGKTSSAKPGTFVGSSGYLHTFLQGHNLQETLWMNLFTRTQIHDMSHFYPQGLGVAPWENRPSGENCPVAISLKESLMGRLTPLSRFCLLAENGLHYVEGIHHPDHTGGGIDPSVSSRNVGKTNAEALLTDPHKRPWRMLSSMLAFLQEKQEKSMDCLNLRLNIGRSANHGSISEIGIWSGGLRVSNKSGEQFPAGTDDFLESLIWLNRHWVNGEGDVQWFLRFQTEIKALEKLSGIVRDATSLYFDHQRAGKKAAKKAAKAIAGQAVALFWERCNHLYLELIDACSSTDEEIMYALRKKFARFAENAYDAHCPRDTARQIDAWAASSPLFDPAFGRYLRPPVSKKPGKKTAKAQTSENVTHVIPKEDAA